MAVREILYVSPFGDLWEVKEQFNQAARLFSSEAAALVYARKIAAGLTPSEMVIVGRDGRMMAREVIEYSQHLLVLKRGSEHRMPHTLQMATPQLSPHPNRRNLDEAMRVVPTKSWQ